MPRGSRTLTFVKGRRIRVTRLDGCARPVLGEYGQAVSEGVTTVDFTPNTTDTDEISVLNFAGDRCVYEPSVTTLSGYALSLTFCNVDLDVFEIITGQTLVFDAFGNVIGLEVDTKIDVADQGFALEVWAGAPAGDTCTDPNAQGAFGYVLLPFLKGGYLSGFSITNGEITFTIEGASTREGNQWGNGPYNVELGTGGTPAQLFQPVSPTAALRLQEVAVAPPVAAVGARPLLDPELPALTSIAGTVSGAEVDFATTPAATGPVWWDFGDLEWDYVAAPGAADHTYQRSGTYTVRATQNGRNWTSTTVTVTVP